ncbi:MAG: LrgB family protein [Oscillibacter sp.]|nr:LrgB family protein [Oscillibacter sp.]
MSGFINTPFFGIVLSMFAYFFGQKMQKKFKFPLCNTMLVAGFLIIGVLLILNVSHETYNQGGTILSLMVNPATMCLSLGIYDKWELLKKNALPVLVGCGVGVITAVGSVWVMCRMFGLDRAVTAALLPKSVTMPIATAVAESHGGITSITIAAVIVAGLIGNIGAPFFIKLFRVKDPLAVGLAIGASSHALGTAKAMEIGKTEGAMSGLAIALCGVMTAIVALGFGVLL